MWLFDGNIITTKCIGIGLKKSKYNDFEITKDTIHERLRTVLHSLINIYKIL